MTTIKIDASLSGEYELSGHNGSPITFDGDPATIAFAANHVAQVATTLANTVGGGLLAFKILTDLADTLQALAENAGIAENAQDDTPDWTHRNRHDGELVVMKMVQNGIVIYDSEDEQDQELLDYVFVDLFEPLA